MAPADGGRHGAGQRQVLVSARVGRSTYEPNDTLSIETPLKAGDESSSSDLNRKRTRVGLPGFRNVTSAGLKSGQPLNPSKCPASVHVAPPSAEYST